jgi:hypothetical protein
MMANENKMHIAKMLCDVRVEDDEKFEHLLTRQRG